MDLRGLGAYDCQVAIFSMNDVRTSNVILLVLSLVLGDLRRESERSLVAVLFVVAAEGDKRNFLAEMSDNK